MRKIGFFGAGNMGFALIQAMNGQQNVFLGAYDVSGQALDRVRALGAQAFDSAAGLVSWADILICCVKPQYIDSLLAMLPQGAQKKPVASIVAGLDTSRLRTAFAGSPVLRIMPNTPAMVGEGMIVFCQDTGFSKEDQAFMQTLFERAGKVLWAQESQMDAVTALSGSGPAYVYLMIEALTEAGVREGLSFATAKELAAQTVLGSAKMVLQSDAHPANLRAQVTSPAGTTAEGVYALEKGGLKAAVYDAVRAAADRSRKLGEKK